MSLIKQLVSRMKTRLSLVLPNVYIINYIVMARKFKAANGRAPLKPTSHNASLNDVIFDRMIRNRWTSQQIRCVDKAFAKDEAKVLSPDIVSAKTISVLPVSQQMTVAELVRDIAPFMGKRLVAKPTHGSGVVVFLDDENATDQLERLLKCAKANFFGEKRETQYTYLQKKIIIEENVCASGEAPIDYKFFCFGGVPEFCQIDVGRFGTHRRAIFDVRTMQESVIRIGPYPRAKSVRLPDNFQAMARAAQALAAPFDIVRIDLYSVRDVIYFSEFTFSPHAAVMKVENDAEVIEMVRKVTKRIAPTPLPELKSLHSLEQSAA